MVTVSLGVAAIIATAINVHDEHCRKEIELNHKMNSAEFDAHVMSNQLNVSVLNALSDKGSLIIYCGKLKYPSQDLSKSHQPSHLYHCETSVEYPKHKHISCGLDGRCSDDMSIMKYVMEASSAPMYFVLDKHLIEKNGFKAPYSIIHSQKYKELTKSQLSELERDFDDMMLAMHYAMKNSGAGGF